MRQALLRQFYHHTATRAHPDRFINNPAQQQQTTAFVTQLNEAYASKNPISIRPLAQQLDDGLVFLKETTLPDNPDIWPQLLKKLTKCKRNPGT